VILAERGRPERLGDVFHQHHDLHRDGPPARRMRGEDTRGPRSSVGAHAVRLAGIGAHPS
jgi:hypothetical protein